MFSHRKAEIQRELDELRGQAEAPVGVGSSYVGNVQSPIDADVMGSLSTSEPVSISQQPFSIPQPLSVAGSLSITQDTVPPAYDPPSKVFDESSVYSQDTAVRWLDGILVESFKINDCFSSYGKQLHTTPQYLKG